MYEAHIKVNHHHSRRVHWRMRCKPRNANILKFALVLITLCLLQCLHTVDGAKKGKHLKISLKSRNRNIRPVIILCCGKKKCSQWANQKKNTILHPGQRKNSTAPNKSINVRVPNKISGNQPRGSTPGGIGGSPKNTPSPSDNQSQQEQGGLEPTAPGKKGIESTEDPLANNAETSGDSSASATVAEDGNFETGSATSTLGAIAGDDSASQDSVSSPDSAPKSTLTISDQTTTAIAMISTANSSPSLLSATNSNATTSTATNTSPKTTTTTTATTTPPSLCKEPCQTFNNATSTLSAKMSMPSGNYLMIGGKMVFLSTVKTSLYAAAQQCLRLGMSLLSVDDPAKNVSAIMAAVAGKFPSVSDFWTSGAQEGEFCDTEGVYSWCSNGKREFKAQINLKFLDLNAILKPSDRCLALKSADSSLGLYHAPCSNDVQKTALCEPKCNSPVCPISQCAPDLTLFDADNNVKDADKLGFWANTCGSTYFFSNSLGTWEQNWQKCCSLGLVPIAFETQSELKCISDFTKSNWKYNFNYWTSGTQNGCKGQWAWCSGVDALPFPNNLNWAFNQPDNRAGADDCLQMRLLKNDSGIVLSDRNCSDKFVFACEGNPKLQSCLKPTFKAINCTRNQTLFTGDELKDFYSYGNWLSGCGRTFMFSKNKATWEEAREICCSIGTTLLSVEYDDKDTCIASVAKRFKSLQQIDFWTSGTDQACKGVNFWASSNKKVINRKMSWTNAVSGDCMSVQYSNGSSQFSKLDCAKESYFACEVRNTGTIAQGLQNECMQVWNITMEDMLGFEGSYDASNITSRLKCFIKCIGENLELFSANGLMPSEKMLRMIEDIAGEDDDKLQNSFSAYDTCSGKVAADECETAAGIYQCGRDLAPQITSEMYNQQLGNSTVYIAPTPCIGTQWRQCKMSHLPCIQNANLIEQLSLTNSTSMGSIKYTPNGVKYFVSIAPTPLDWTWLASREYCCSLGMYLAHFPTNAALKDFWPFRKNINTYYGYMDETYANGEGSDSYCRSNAPILTENYWGPGYMAPVCNVQSCWLHHFDVVAVDKPGLKYFSADNCIPEKSTEGKYFACM